MKIQTTVQLPNADFGDSADMPIYFENAHYAEGCFQHDGISFYLDNNPNEVYVIRAHDLLKIAQVLQTEK